MVWKVLQEIEDEWRGTAGKGFSRETSALNTGGNVLMFEVLPCYNRHEPVWRMLDVGDSFDIRSENALELLRTSGESNQRHYWH